MLSLIISLSLCQAAIAVPSVEETLARGGYSDSIVDVVMAWNEHPKSSDSLVFGVRLSPKDGTPAFDIYYDETGMLLSETDLDRLGVAPKQWTWRAITQPAEWPVASKASPPAPPRPKSADAQVEQLALDVPDVETARQEDDWGVSSPDKGVLRIGLLEPLSAPIRVSTGTALSGAWQALPDGGRLWALTLNAAGAEGLRIHCSVANLGTNAALMVYPAGAPSEACAPITPTGPIWTPTCFSDSVTIEWYLPHPEKEGDEAALGLEIDAIAYQYRKLDGLMKRAASCNIDLPCQPDWLDIGGAVGGIGTIGSSGSLWCTGTLLADEDPATDLPYFLTANHCVSSQGEANTLEVYWLYQQSECAGLPPNPRIVPRTTGGADYLTGSPESYGSDVTLLRLRGEVPADIPHAGYSTVPWPIGNDVACIHHPSGDYKRISFGKKVNTGSPTEWGQHLESLDRFHEILWNLDGGTTEPGSSGCPLFVQTPEGDQLVVGQLYGGYAACDAKEEPDYFGRFDTSYPLLAPFLQVPAVSEGEVEGEMEGEGESDTEGEGEGEGMFEGEGEGELITLDSFRETLISQFDLLDGNGDGFLTISEIQEKVTGTTVSLFAELDANADGRLSAEEVGVRPDPNDKIPINGGGTVEGEQAITPPVPGCFAARKRGTAEASPGDMAWLAVALAALVPRRGKFSKR